MSNPSCRARPCPTIRLWRPLSSDDSVSVPARILPRRNAGSWRVPQKFTPSHFDSRSSQQRKLANHGIHALYRRPLAQCFHHGGRIIQRGMPNVFYLYMRAETDNLGLYFAAKAADYRQRQKQRGHSYSYATDGDVDDKPEEAASLLASFRANQVAEGYKSVK